MLYLNKAKKTHKQKQWINTKFRVTAISGVPGWLSGLKN